MLGFFENDSISQFEIPCNKQEFVGSPFIYGKSVEKDKVAKYSALKSFYGSSPKVCSWIWAFNKSFREDCFADLFHW